MIQAIAAFFNPGKPLPPERNPKYRAFLRTFPCVCCGEPKRTEAAHFGPHGIAQKSSDLLALPLCPEHHRTGPHAYHKMRPVNFAIAHDLDIESLQTYFQHLWEMKKAKAA